MFRRKPTTTGADTPIEPGLESASVTPGRDPAAAAGQLIRAHRWRVRALAAAAAGGMALSGLIIFSTYPHDGPADPDFWLGPFAGVGTGVLLACTLIGTDVGITWATASRRQQQMLAAAQAVLLAVIGVSVLGGVWGKFPAYNTFVYLCPPLLAAMTSWLVWELARAQRRALVSLGYFTSPTA